MDQVAGSLTAIDGVEDVHDLHVWVLTSGMNVATAHLVSQRVQDFPDVLQQAKAVLRDDFAIEHATIQVEPSASDECRELGW